MKGILPAFFVRDDPQIVESWQPLYGRSIAAPHVRTTDPVFIPRVLA
jgi:hypothetical protein